MARTRRQAGWKQSGDVADFLPQEHEEEEFEHEYWDGTLEHINSMARMAAGRARYNTSSVFDKRDTASSAISMMIVEDADTPVIDLINGGLQAIAREHQSRLATHGARITGAGTGRGFAVYWLDKQQHFDSYNFSKAAIHQVFNELSERHQKDLLGASSHDSISDYARAIGLTVPTVSVRVKEARIAAMKLWFDWETPPPIKRQSRRHEAVTHCPQGHDQSIHRKWKNWKARGRTPYCGECHRQRNRKKKNEQEEAAKAA